jgi:hypothetical protein
MARRGEQTTRSRREIYCRKPSMLATTDRRGGGGGRRAAGWVLIDLRDGVSTGVTGGAKTLGGGSAWLASYGRLRATTGGHRDRVEISRNGRAKGRGREEATQAERETARQQRQTRPDSSPIHSNATLSGHACRTATSARRSALLVVLV